MIRFDQSVCQNLDAALRREWLETNGLGGYASSTIIGLNTRRYHGLLVAATQPPAGRMVLLSKLEETLVVGGRRYDLSANRYPGVVHPQGYLYLKEFRLDPHPIFVYNVDGLEIEKSVRMVQGENATIIRYVLLSPRPDCTLELRPLIAFRDFHSTTHENPALDARFQEEANFVRMAPYGDATPPLYLIHSGAVINEAGFWYRNFEYDAERQRGLDFHEDLFNPLVLLFDLARDPQVTVTACLASSEVRHNPCPRPPAPSPVEQSSVQFIVRRADHHTIIAGYHWFADWGRDTMIALPGLARATGRYDLARDILLAWAAHADQGMLPNRFPDVGETPEYNSVDAALWFFEAARALDAQSLVAAALADIIRWYEHGTRYGIHMDSDGLIYAGEPGTQLTWMDARVGDRPVTPRCGKPVEIQALWYNALRIMEDLTGDSHYRELADRARASFAPLFWNDSAQCLYDVVDGDIRDASIRPNQIFAVSLPHRLLPLEKSKAVVDAVEKHLLTPYGLRTLSPDDPQYRGRFEGDPASRDSAYHQGTVWPWLLGPYVAAYRYVNGRDPANAFDALRQFMDNEGVGQLPEVFDGDPPHRPGGCIAQAWSIAALE